MPNEKQILTDAYGYFANWATGRQQFEALLDPNVQWVETDPDLGARSYNGKAEVMAHLDQIQPLVASASIKSVSQKGQGWEAQDDMKVQNGALHCCISDIDFRGGLISRVVHCKAHGVTIGKGPCT